MRPDEVVEQSLDLPEQPVAVACGSHGHMLVALEPIARVPQTTAVVPTPPRNEEPVVLSYAHCPVNGQKTGIQSGVDVPSPSGSATAVINCSQMVNQPIRGPAEDMTCTTNQQIAGGGSANTELCSHYCNAVVQETGANMEDCDDFMDQSSEHSSNGGETNPFRSNVRRQLVYGPYPTHERRRSAATLTDDKPFVPSADSEEEEEEVEEEEDAGDIYIVDTWSQTLSRSSDQWQIHVIDETDILDTDALHAQERDEDATSYAGTPRSLGRSEEETLGGDVQDASTLSPMLGPSMGAGRVVFMPTIVRPASADAALLRDKSSQSRTSSSSSTAAAIATSGPICMNTFLKTAACVAKRDGVVQISDTSAESAWRAEAERTSATTDVDDATADGCAPSAKQKPMHSPPVVSSELLMKTCVPTKNVVDRRLSQPAPAIRDGLASVRSLSPGQVQSELLMNTCVPAKRQVACAVSTKTSPTASSRFSSESPASVPSAVLMQTCSPAKRSTSMFPSHESSATSQTCSSESPASISSSILMKTCSPAKRQASMPSCNTSPTSEHFNSQSPVSVLLEDACASPLRPIQLVPLPETLHPVMKSAAESKPASESCTSSPVYGSAVLTKTGCVMSPRKSPSPGINQPNEWMGFNMNYVFRKHPHPPVGQLLPGIPDETQNLKPVGAVQMHTTSSLTQLMQAVERDIRGMSPRTPKPPAETIFMPTGSTTDLFHSTWTFQAPTHASQPGLPSQPAMGESPPFHSCRASVSSPTSEQTTLPTSAQATPRLFLDDFHKRRLSEEFARQSQEAPGLSPSTPKGPVEPLVAQHSQKYMMGNTQSMMSIKPGLRMLYKGCHDVRTCHATVLERTAMGWRVQLETDGEIRDVSDTEIWHLEEAQSPTRRRASRTRSPQKKAKTPKENERSRSPGRRQANTDCRDMKPATNSKLELHKSWCWCGLDKKPPKSRGGHHGHGGRATSAGPSSQSPAQTESGCCSCRGRPFCTCFLGKCPF
eukprot:TRINITY_DN7825_c0_g1_i1.p1 TRINITY_DN7825_c0_g1~~TRINITY_DN7825_c0_g1_i1.p1  ORF type:complete len:999 (+),score=117.23 TRINITY_DN7825_c0_g1_i1:71-3067(+)